VPEGNRDWGPGQIGETTENNNRLHEFRGQRTFVSQRTKVETSKNSKENDEAIGLKKLAQKFSRTPGKVEKPFRWGASKGKIIKLRRILDATFQGMGGRRPTF